MLRVSNLTKYFADIPILRDVQFTLDRGERAAVVGPNGCGKTTLLRIIAGTLAPDSGSIRLGAGIVPAYLSQEQEGLEMQQTPLESVRHAVPMTETDARTFLHGYLFAEDMVFTPIAALSYGERARLALARLVLSGANLLLLDEPTNHLDIASRERLEAALARFRGTTIAVLHDRRAIERLATRTLEVRDGSLLDSCSAATER